jgi:hypothetical protein
MSDFNRFQTRHLMHMLLGAASMLFFCAASAPLLAETIDQRVTASWDDAEEDSVGRVILDSSDLELVFDRSSNQVVGIRFTNLDLPAQAVIEQAYLQFRVDEVNTGATSLSIRGEASDSANNFSTTDFDISLRPLTIASATWEPPPWTTVNAEGPDQRTPDLSAIIQEIVNRPGWQRDNSLAIIISGSGERTAESFDGAAGPLLHIQYSGGLPDSEIDSWADLNITLDGLHVGVDTANNRLLAPIAPGYNTPNDLVAVVEFELEDAGFALSFNNYPAVTSGDSVTFSGIHYGSTVPVNLYQNGVLLESHDLVFTNLPVIQLTADVIVDEPKNPGKFILTSGEYGEDTGLLSMGIEFRGQTSQRYPKKSFGLEIVKDDDPTDEKNITPLGLRKDGDWILDATYRDTSFFRNIMSMDIYNAMRPSAFVDSTGEARGHAAIRGRHVEVILNEAYHGSYIFEERIDRKQLDLDKINVPEDELGNDRWDQVDWSDPENGTVVYKADSNNADMYPLADLSSDWEQEYPDEDDIIYWAPLQELIDFVNNSTDEEFVSSIGDIVDLDSAVDFWLMTNLTMNRDSLKKNYFIARNKSEKWFFVPWDNDATFGMLWDGSPYTTTNWWDPAKNNLIRRLSELPDTGFNGLAKARWTELRASIVTEEAIMAGFDEYFDGAVPVAGETENVRSRNLVRWPESGGEGVNNPELATREYINNWLVGRIAFLDVKIYEQEGEPPIVCEDTTVQTNDPLLVAGELSSVAADDCGTNTCHP